jgi:hypothetical protein
MRQIDGQNGDLKMVPTRYVNKEVKELVSLHNNAVSLKQQHIYVPRCRTERHATKRRIFIVRRFSCGKTDKDCAALPGSREYLAGVLLRTRVQGHMVR